MVSQRIYGQMEEQNGLPQQPYGRIMSVVTSLITLTCVISIVSFQLLHFTFVQASQEEEITGFMGALVPLIAHSHLLKEANPRQQLQLSIGLQPHNLAHLNGDIQNILQNSQPGEERMAQFLPDKNFYIRLSHYLQDNGFTITHTYTHRLLIDFRGTVEQTEHFFHIKINIYSGADHLLFYANSTAPLVPTWLKPALVSINGLNNTLYWYHSPLHLHAGQAPDQLQANGCPKENQGAITPDQLASLYNLDSLYQEGIQGEGQTIALFETGSVNQDDLNAYSACFGHGHPTIQISGDGSEDTSITPGAIQADADLILSTAPKLDTLKIYEAQNNAFSYLSQWAQILADAPAIVETNWQQCENDLPAQTIQQEHIFFEFAALQGQSLLASSGNKDDSCGDTGQAISDPATQPFITGVGGTTFTNPENPHKNQETAWDTPDADDGSIANGGTSHYWPIPSWQHMVGIPDSINNPTPTCTWQPGKNTGGTGCREVPDVSLNADPRHGYWIYCSTCNSNTPWMIGGGTATATTIWTAFVALANELSIKQGGFNLGFLNPLLYDIANDPVKYEASFHDVFAGNGMATSAEQHEHPSTIGYDMATGLGSIKGLSLATNLIEEALQHTGLHMNGSPTN